MFFSTVISVAMLLATAVADTHHACTCVKNGAYDAGITSAACDFYTANKYKWGTTIYDSGTGWCTAVGTGSIAGNQWESACQHIDNSGVVGRC